MENRLYALFDLQRFHNNRRLCGLIEEALQSIEGTLDDDMLSFVAAAGDPNTGLRDFEEQTDDM